MAADGTNWIKLTLLEPCKSARQPISVAAIGRFVLFSCACDLPVAVVDSFYWQAICRRRLFDNDRRSAAIPGYALTDQLVVSSFGKEKSTIHQPSTINQHQRRGSEGTYVCVEERLSPGLAIPDNSNRRLVYNLYFSL